MRQPHTDLAGFGELDANGRNVGFDIDFCRAIAAALLDDPEAVEFVPLSAAERGPALQTGEVDVPFPECNLDQHSGCTVGELRPCLVLRWPGLHGASRQRYHRDRATGWRDGMCHQRYHDRA